MARVPLVIALVSMLGSGCGGELARENADLKAKNGELAAKLVAVESENLRLKQQIELLTKHVDDLTDAVKAREAAGVKTK